MPWLRLHNAHSNWFGAKNLWFKYMAALKLNFKINAFELHVWDALHRESLISAFGLQSFWCFSFEVRLVSHRIYYLHWVHCLLLRSESGPDSLSRSRLSKLEMRKCSTRLPSSSSERFGCQFGSRASDILRLLTLFPVCRCISVEATLNALVPCILMKHRKPQIKFEKNWN